MRTLLVTLILAIPVFAADPPIHTGGPVDTDGTRAVINLPAKMHMQNTGGTDGLGLCVDTSVTMAARWQAVREYLAFRSWAEKRPGGSYPEQLIADLAQYARDRGVSVAPYVMSDGGDETFLDLAINTRRCPCITYDGLDGFYTEPVAHMVDCADLDETHGAILDSNRPGKWVWMTRRQLIHRWLGQTDDGRPAMVLVSDGQHVYWTPLGGGWAFAWLKRPTRPAAHWLSLFNPPVRWWIPMTEEPTGARYWLNGRPCDRQTALEALSD